MVAVWFRLVKGCATRFGFPTPAVPGAPMLVNLNPFRSAALGVTLSVALGAAFVPQFFL